MSTPLFLLASLGCALGLVGLFFLVGLAGRRIPPSVNGLHHRWLERRLRRRLARGEDSYFEELRSIEAALERERRPAALPARSPLDRILFGASVLLLGLVTLTMFLPEDARPAWTRRATGLSLIMIGLQWAGGMAATVDNPRRGARFIGVAMIVLGSLFFALDLSRSH